MHYDFGLCNSLKVHKNRNNTVQGMEDLKCQNFNGNWKNIGKKIFFTFMILFFDLTHNDISGSSLCGILCLILKKMK